ncbi:PP2C family protein-serine/threonine phosphatase [Coleofasciculus sp.]|uniref:PP2C family protein-serine/threonine phosphatase n=1 Tax=Coleofasciculus sp. TaxID=3100458 RepID=UPI0039FA4EA6
MSTEEPQTNRYLWAVGATAASFPVGEMVAQRYQVVAPQIWLDLHPEELPQAPDRLNGMFLPYLRLYPHRLHVPEVYGVCSGAESESDTPIILLENVPIDNKGELYPAITSQWSQASPLRQIYWLWQILELWQPLAELGVAATLVDPEQVRVEGWRVRLRELVRNGTTDFQPVPLSVTGERKDSSTGASGGTTTLPHSRTQASLQQLGQCWESWCHTASVTVAAQLRDIAQQMQTPNPSFDAIAVQLNQLLLAQSSQQPLRLEVAGLTDTGPLHDHNEDSCYPLRSDLTTEPDPLISHLSIVCDGIGGHEGGEVASHIAMQSVKIQVRALLAELLEDPELMSPDLVAQQLSAIVRVVNNLIASKNDQQERESRRRMGTTLTIALQLPQKVIQSDSEGNSHELYIVSVGDSRAYWITPDYCQQLTVDDDVAAREVRMGRSLYRHALQRPDSGALTQAIGTKEAESLYPHVRRFILEEDGLLLLCSDGVSDNNWLESIYGDFAKDVFSGKLSLEAAAKFLVDQANQRNGYDNASVVLSYCAVSPQYPVVLNLGGLQLEKNAPTIELETELPATQEPVAEEEEDVSEPIDVETVSSSQDWFKIIIGVFGILVIIFSAGAAVFIAQWLLNPQAFKQMRDRFSPPQPIEQLESVPDSPPELEE